jgi:hypothetical protein
MDIDFHYYATYVAAITAGYSEQEATTIAHAAQYIDDNDSSKLLGHAELGFFAVPTVQTNTELGWGRVSSSLSDGELRKVWVPFHFLPGNFQSKVHPDPDYKTRVKPFTGRRSDSGLVDQWQYDARAEEEFKLLCLPYSPMVVAMIADTVQKYRDNLCMVGIRIHVLIDTFAHMYFAGTPAWHINNMGDVYDVTESDAGRKIAWGGANDEWATPDGLTYNSFMYTGHARLGHLPDYPWVKYRYTPQWSSTPIVKDSREEYTHAFVEMVGALRAIRAGHPYVPKTTSVDATLMDQVRQLIHARLPFGMPYDNNTGARMENWRRMIPQMKRPDGAAMKVPETYNADAWLQQARSVLAARGPIQATDYYRFNLGAREHLTFVERELEREGIKLLDAAADTTGPICHWQDLSLMAATDERPYVGKMVEEYSPIGWRNEYWPTMAKERTTLRFDYPANVGPQSGSPMHVVNGQEIRISTTETSVGEHKYLGIWNPKNAYYYKPEYDEQVWVVSREAPNVAGPLVFGERIYLKQKSSGQFLCPDGKYLARSSTPYPWIASTTKPR